MKKKKMFVCHRNDEGKYFENTHSTANKGIKAIALEEDKDDDITEEKTFKAFFQLSLSPYLHIIRLSN